MEHHLREHIFSLAVGPFMTNCYVVGTGNGNAIVVDPGFDAQRIHHMLVEKGLTLRKVLLTHGHFDHINACTELLSLCGGEVPVYVHENDARMLTDPSINCAHIFSGYTFHPVSNCQVLHDGDIVTQDAFSFQVIHTPGHTAGCVVFQCEDLLFTGDTLFKGTIGRTDHYSGDTLQEIRSVRILADTLQGDYLVLPGHEETTTLEQERRYNPYLQPNAGELTYDD